MDRRSFLRGVGALAGTGVAAAIAAACGSPRAMRPRPAPTSTTAPVVDLDGLPVAEWLVEENRRPGSYDWVIRRAPAVVAIEGYTDKVSATAGDELAVHVRTTSLRFRAEVYRMGFYQGRGARLIESLEGARHSQSPPRFSAGTNTIECDWSRSFVLDIDDRYPAGNYLIKLVGQHGQVRHVPFLVRDDASHAAFVVQSSVTTWQAYNLWAGYSLYGGVPIGGASEYDSRSRVVSFDRPYGHPPLDAFGSGDWLGNEFPFVYFAERHGLDVTYWTDVDLHARPGLLLNHRSLVSLGHDEYWSMEMRDGVSDALDQGVNFAVLGANCCYRQIRFEDSPLGPLRRVICYKDYLEDPIYPRDKALATGMSWATDPEPRPESELVGSMYQSFGGSGDLVVVDGTSFVYAGTGLRNGSRVPRVIGSEFDAFEPGLPGPRNVEILAHSPTSSASGSLHSDMTYYTRPGGGGVFASGTADWVTSLWHGEGPLPGLLSFGIATGVAPLTTITTNVLRAFGSGPAGAQHRSVANWSQFYAPNAQVNLGKDV